MNDQFFVNKEQDRFFKSFYGFKNNNEIFETMSDSINNLKAQGFNFDVPSTLYRYRNEEYGLKEIEEEYIHLSSVDSMKDRFECLFSLSHLLDKILDEETDNYIADEFIDKWKKDLGICCFCEKYDSFSMWDRYADGYKGICIEYDLPKLKLNKVVPIAVNYSKNAYEYCNKDVDNLFEYLLTSIIGSILTKNIEYSTEKEWRYISAINKPNVHVPESIKRVYLGTNCSKNKKKIIHACRKKGIEVIELTASRHNYSFNEKCIVKSR